MKKLDKSKEELIKELNNLHKKQHIVVDLYKKDLQNYKNEKANINSNYDSQESEIQRLISEHEVILIELELMIQELAFQNEEKEKIATELILANRQLSFQNKEKEKKAKELIATNALLSFQNEEKEKTSKKLAIANSQLSFQNKEKRKRAEELANANFILAYENEEKARKTEELAFVYNALIKKQQRLDILLEVSNSGIWGLNIQTGKTIYNERWANIIGYTLDEISPINMVTAKKFTHPEDKKKSDLLLQKYFNGEVDYYECESRMKHKNGHWVWVLDRGKVNEWDDDGNMLMMSGIHEDITERKLAEIKLRESEDRYRSLVEWSPETIVVQRDGKIIYVNPSGVKTLKVDTIEDLLGKPIYDWVHPDSYSTTLERIKTLVKIGEFMPSIELKLIAHDRTIVYVESQALVINYDGEPAVQYSIRDISHKKKLEDLLSKVNSIARLGALELNLKNYNLNLSKITKEILEVADDFEIDLDNAISFFNLEERRNEILDIIKKGIQTEQKWELELKIRTAKGNDLWVKIIGETEFINGNPTRINGSFQDINDRKETQIALHKNMKELENYKLALDQSVNIAVTNKKGIINNVKDI
jgi:PAS domain S-box-containing protein